MDPTQVTGTIFGYAKPTLKRWIIGGVTWLAVRYGIKAISSPDLAAWADSTIDQAAPFIIAGISAAISWAEKKALHSATPPPTPALPDPVVVNRVSSVGDVK